LAAALATTLSACTRTAPSAHHSGAAQAPAGPGTICARFAVAALSSDTAIDAGPADARRRAADQFGTSALRQQLTGQGDDSAWVALAAHQASVSVSTTTVTDDPPPVGPNQAGAGVVAHQAASGSGGWHEALPDTVVYCTLVADGASWKVDSVTFTTDTSADDATAAAASTQASS
jgi:hypothetical protein